MKTYLTFLLMLLANLVFAEATITKVKVDPKELEEFKKPIPELLIFNSKNECIYKSYGFSTEADLNANLDYLFGFPNDLLPGAIVKSKFTEDFKNKNPSFESIPKEEQEKIISDILAKIIKESIQKFCPENANKIYGTLLNNENQPFNPGNLSAAQFTIVEYYTEWCVPCKKIEADLNIYFKNRKVSVNWLKVERDSQKL